MSLSARVVGRELNDVEGRDAFAKRVFIRGERFTVRPFSSRRQWAAA